MRGILDWQNMTGAQIAALEPARTVITVTCSPLEVHGPHLPTAADMAESEGLFGAILGKLAERHRDVTFVRLPPMYVAADVLPHVGSLKFSPRAVTSVLEELGATLARQGFKNLWVGNFHGGPRHILAIERAAHRVNKAHGARMVSVFSLLARRITGGSSDLAAFLDGVGGISKEDLKGDQHGGAVETAMLLHLVGQHVDSGYRDLPARSLELELARDKKRPLQRGEKVTLLEIIRSLPLRARYYERETYAGSPARASADLGRQYLELLSKEAADALTDLLEGRIGLGACYSPLWPMRHVLLSETVGWLFDRVVRSRPSPV
jgi:creatinine amidohydrolase